MRLDKEEIPVLDCSLISGPLEGLEETQGFKTFTKQLGVGMNTIGFVYFVNHGVTPEIIESSLEQSRRFFGLSKETKMKYRKENAVENFFGYTPMEDEIVDEGKTQSPDRKEAWDVWGPDALISSKYPCEVPLLKPAIDSFRSSLVLLTKKIFLCFGHYLNLEDPSFFSKRHLALDDMSIQSHNVVRSNYYMPLDPKEEVHRDAMRLTEHSDWGTVTFLIQDCVGGLEAKNMKGEWIPVPPIKDSIVLNAGLMLEMWSGGHFPATHHRVRLLRDKATTLRQSLGFFVQPDGNSNCVPIVQEKADWTPLYPKVDKGMTHFEYFRDRIRGTRAY